MTFSCFTLPSSTLSVDDLQSILQTSVKELMWKCSVQLYKGEQESLLTLTDSTFPDDTFILSGSEWIHLGQGSAQLLTKLIPTSSSGIGASSKLKPRQSVTIQGVSDLESYWIGSLSPETLLIITNKPEALPFAQLVLQNPTYQQTIHNFISLKYY